MDIEDKSVLDKDNDAPPSERGVGKKQWETPQIHSTEIFESFTLQSCNQTPGDACQGALE
ncbi:MAG: hypothetical protein HUU55_08125 [Myxococcales bacterium]|nr:hypothetical protein [Myxococcales bacterium]